jgi:oxygen-independent coproporphyrinogen-3 oxidase
VAEAKVALGMAMKTFDRVSLDLIYARPDQTEQQWRGELSEALAFGTDHLSLYQLTIEPATPFATLARTGSLTPLDDDNAASLYEITQEMTQAAGRPAYEISNHAKPGEESRHNLLYWRYGQYAGVGTGAHGRLDIGGKRIATMNEKLPERWQQAVSRRGHGIIEESDVANEDAAREHLLMNLRLAEGLDLAAYKARWNTTPDMARVAELSERGFLTTENGRLIATPQGRLVLNRLIAEISA